MSAVNGADVSDAVKVKVAVIVPCFNVASRIGAVLRTMPHWVHTIYVINDGSRDDTAAAVRAVTDPRVQLLEHRQNRGVGAALASGYRQALAENMDILCVLAGDGQMDPADLAAVIAPIVRGEAGYVKGNRLRHPAVWRAMPNVRLAGNVVLSALTRWATGLSHVGDSQCGYTAMDAQAAAKIDFDQLWPRYGYPNDLLATLARLQVTVRDVVVRPVYDGAPSGIRWSDALVTIPAILLRATWRRATNVSARESQARAESPITKAAHGAPAEAGPGDVVGDSGVRNEFAQYDQPGGGSASSTPPAS